MKDHMNTDHGSEKFQCPNCDKGKIEAPADQEGSYPDHEGSYADHEGL